MVNETYTITLDRDEYLTCRESLLVAKADAQRHARSDAPFPTHAGAWRAYAHQCEAVYVRFRDLEPDRPGSSEDTRSGQEDTATEGALSSRREPRGQFELAAEELSTLLGELFGDDEPIIAPCECDWCGHRSVAILRAGDHTEYCPRCGLDALGNGQAGDPEDMREPDPDVCDKAKDGQHEWYAPRNSIITSGEYCVWCGLIRAGKQPGEPWRMEDPAPAPAPGYAYKSVPKRCAGCGDFTTTTRHDDGIELCESCEKVYPAPDVGPACAIWNQDPDASFVARVRAWAEYRIASRGGQLDYELDRL